MVGGVYNGPSNSPLTLTGPLVLDRQGDPNSVFIFQTGSTLVTGSTFTGNILALTSISATTGVTIHGRAFARNGAVTLDNDVFTNPTCDLTPSTPRRRRQQQFPPRPRPLQPRRS